MTDTNRLDAFIADSMKHNKEEASIIRKLFTACKAAGDPIVSVWDGEDDNPVSTLKSINTQAFNLDQCHLYTKSGGWVFIVMGNGWDAISDYTTSLDPIIDPVLDWVASHDDY